MDIGCGDNPKDGPTCRSPCVPNEGYGVVTGMGSGDDIGEELCHRIGCEEYKSRDEAFRWQWTRL